MADSSINTSQRYLLDGNEFNAPIEWEESKVTANYENDAVQPQLEIGEFTLTLEAREFILQWIRDGRIYEGMPFDLTLFNINLTPKTFKSMIDFTKGYRDLEQDGKVEVAITKLGGLDSFFDQIGTVTYGYLENEGIIRDSDYIGVDYVVQKKFNIIELITTTIVIYLMVKEIQESIKRIASNAAITGGLSSSGPFGVVGAAIFAIATLILDVIYTVAMIVAIIDLAETLINSFVPIKRTHKVINLKRALTIVCNYFGYEFETSVTELSNVAYMSSNLETDEQDKLGFIKLARGIEKGVPNASDYGYNCEEMFEIAKKLCNGRYTIVNKTVHLRPKGDSYWIQNSSYEIPSINIEQKTFNLDELEATKLLKFRTDLQDEYTIDNYTGTTLEVRTDLISVASQNLNLLKGFLEVDFGVALGTRKDELTAIEKLLKSAAGVIDKTTGVLGKGTKLSAKIKDRIGILKVSSNYNSVPKLLYLNGSTLPSNHRTLFNAQTLYNKYYQEDSFVLNNFKGQKAIYNQVEIPFGLEQFNQILNNSYFLFRGKEAKIINFEWIMGQDKATIDFWTREVYTRNLKEIQIVQD